MPEEPSMDARIDEANERREWAREVLQRWLIDLGYAPPRWAHDLRAQRD